jgi:hypothetical protein
LAPISDRRPSYASFRFTHLPHAFQTARRLARGASRLVFLIALVAAFAAGQAKLELAPGAKVITISPPGATGDEEVMSVNRFNPNQVVMAYGGTVGGMAAYSSDAGRAWNLVSPTHGKSAMGGNKSITFDDRGNVYLSYQLIEKLGSPGYWGHNARGNGIWVRHSPDGGKTWDEDAVPVLVWPNGQPAPQQEDMARIWADNEPNSPYRGNLYLAWIDWQIDKSIVLFTRSTDHGKTWDKPWRISTHAGYPRDDTGAILGILGTVGPDGTQYVVWNDMLDTVLAISRDGGKTFEPSHPIFQTGPQYFGGAASFPGIQRVMGLPEIAMDERNGNLYVTWSDCRNGDADVFISRSTDHGQTWSPAMRVNDDPIHDGADQFYQWLAVDPTNGDVYVQFYDRRADPDNLKIWVTLARSTDGGQTFKNYAWTTEPFVGHNTFLGDYPWLVAYGGRVYGTWAEAISDSKAVVECGGCGTVGTPAIIKIGVADFSNRR